MIEKLFFFCSNNWSFPMRQLINMYYAEATSSYAFWTDNMSRINLIWWLNQIIRHVLNTCEFRIKLNFKSNEFSIFQTLHILTGKAGKEVDKKRKTERLFLMHCTQILTEECSPILCKSRIYSPRSVIPLSFSKSLCWYKCVFSEET